MGGRRASRAGDLAVLGARGEVRRRPRPPHPVLPRQNVVAGEEDPRIPAADVPAETGQIYRI